MLNAICYEEIESIIKDKTRVLTDSADLASYSYDASFGSYMPDAVVQVMATDEVAGLIRIANKYKIPVTPRGQGSSLSGGPLPVKGGIVIDVSQWRQKLEVNPNDMVAIVSPGVVTAEIDKAAALHGLMYPPDPSSAHVSTIAGNLAENSGGPRGLKYGVTKDYVLGLEVVTPEGHIIRTGGSTVKNVTGYDLTKLIVGSEGTLGVITEATLRLIPRPVASRTLMAIFNSLVDSGHAITKILTSGILPSKIELMDQASIRAVEDYQPLGLPTDAEAILLIELDGHPAALDDELVQIEKILKSMEVIDLKVARDHQDAAKLWKARKLVSPAIVKKKPTKISEDATVPRSQIPNFFKRLQKIKETYQVDLVVFGHAGDGNMHPNIICDKRDSEEMIRVEQAVTAIFKAALELGGTLSGEHGIGTMKASFMTDEFDYFSLDMMRRIKQAWDPNEIMNPGKIFPEPGQRLVLKD